MLQDQLFSITMEGGHVVLRVHFDSNTKLVLKSSKRLNNIADMTHIDATVGVSASGETSFQNYPIGTYSYL